MANIQPHMNKAKDEVKAAAGEVKRDAQNAVSDYTDRAKDAAANVTDKAREVASSVMERAKDTASNLGKKAESGLESVGSGLTSAAGTIRENLPEEGMLHNVGTRVAEGLETGGRYIREEGFSGMADDLTDLIRRNPIPALLVGVGVGFLLARATTSRS
ncbi:MAG TPA: hypothetical protein VL371_01725 [Gemmataceae bacterium]|jgi:hypothetical protein|nr:hypothetical protein [Gemmataceae bacterium]